MAVSPTRMVNETSEAPRPAADDDAALAEHLVGWFDADKYYAVALSGGVDSAVVAKAAVLSNASVVAATARSSSVAQRELDDAEQLVSQIGMGHVYLETREVDDALYRRNDAKRCYHCKTHLFATMRLKFPDRMLLTGTNADDLQDYRPGLTAAKEAGVRAPLAELNISKAGVRRLASFWGLHLADKPASPCLASRLAHGVAVTPERLSRVERAEQVLHRLGLNECRVRLHPDELARIEVAPSALQFLVSPDIRQALSAELHAMGFRFVTLDLDGFRSGSLKPIEVDSPHLVLPTLPKR